MIYQFITTGNSNEQEQVNPLLQFKEIPHMPHRKYLDF